MCPQKPPEPECPRGILKLNPKPPPVSTHGRTRHWLILSHRLPERPGVGLLGGWGPRMGFGERETSGVDRTDVCTRATRLTMLKPLHVPHPKTCTSGSITCGAVRSARTSFLQAQHTLKPDPMSQICPGPHKLNRKSFAGIPFAIPKP